MAGAQHPSAALPISASPSPATLSARHSQLFCVMQEAHRGRGRSEGAAHEGEGGGTGWGEAEGLEWGAEQVWEEVGQEAVEWGEGLGQSGGRASPGALESRHLCT